MAATGYSPSMPGTSQDLPGNTLHAEICRAILRWRAEDEDLPHSELNVNHPEAGTVLMWACDQGLREASLAILACRHFVMVGARRCTDKSTALHLAANAGLDAVVEGILAHPDFALAGAVDADGFTALHGAAYLGRTKCARLLLECPRFLAAAGNVGVCNIPRPQGHWAREAVTEYNMGTALHMAAARGHGDIVKDILELAPMGTASADLPNRMGATALHMAARGGHSGAVRALLLHNTEFTAVNAKDARGFTALHWAASQASGDIAATIVSHEGFREILAKDLKGRTANDIAREEDHPEVCRLILNRIHREGPGGDAFYARLDEGDVDHHEMRRLLLDRIQGPVDDAGPPSGRR